MGRIEEPPSVSVQLSRTTSGSQDNKRASLPAKGADVDFGDIELAEDEELEAEFQRRDVKKKQACTLLYSISPKPLGSCSNNPSFGQVFRSWVLLLLSFQSLGTIYGDIGTSPLYVYSSTFSSPPLYDDLVGALSLIIWSLTLIVSIKYCFIVLSADDEGEGGTFAIYSLLSRYCNISDRGTQVKHTVKIERYNTGELKRANLSVRRWLEDSKVAGIGLRLISIFGISLILADGVLTPAQSVLGAIQGLEVVVPHISTSTIVGVTCGILVLLFFAQPLGIGRLSSTFAPIVTIWLIFNFSFGIYNLATHDASVLKAFSPYFAGEYFVRNKTEGWKSLGGILLSFTGVEALFADLGAFSKRAIQLSWLCFAYPCLLLAYIGQAAYISRDPSAYSNPFFHTVPPGMFWPSLVVSVLAAIVASQAIITATFQILSQTMNMSYFPHIKTTYTSTKHYGQVYIGMANWLLMAGTILVTAVYSNTTRLGHAYGVCVIMVTFITTCLITLVAIVVWRIHPIIVLLVWLPFAALDGLYLSSALTKVPDGAWFTLMLAAVIASVFMLWRYGKEYQWAAERKRRLDMAPLFEKPKTTSEKESTHSSCQDKTRPIVEAVSSLSPLKGFCIFFDKSGSSGAPHDLPAVYSHFIEKLEAKPEVTVFLHIRPVPVPTISDDERYLVQPVSSLSHTYRVLCRTGYNDEVIKGDLGGVILEQIKSWILRTARFRDNRPEETEDIPPLRRGTNTETAASSTAIAFESGTHPEMTPRIHAASSQAVGTMLANLDRAREGKTIYVVGKQELKIHGPAPLSFKRPVQAIKYAWTYGVLSTFLFVRENTRQKVAEMRIPTEKLIEVGFVVEF